VVAVDVAGLRYREAASALRLRPGTVMSRLLERQGRAKVGVTRGHEEHRE
jgi:DNA-directed RNA polymerase specialized sigma24 family protein